MSIEKLSLKSSVGVTLVDVHLNWLNWFHFRFLGGGLLSILIDSPFLIPRCYKDVTVSFLEQLHSEIFCL